MGMFAIESRIPTRRKGQTDTSPSSSTTNGSAMNGPATAINPSLTGRSPHSSSSASTPRSIPSTAGRRPQRDGSRLVGRRGVAVAAGPEDHPADRNEREAADYECDSDRQRDTG